MFQISFRLGTPICRQIHSSRLMNMHQRADAYFGVDKTRPFDKGHPGPTPKRNGGTFDEIGSKRVKSSARRPAHCPNLYPLSHCATEGSHNGQARTKKTWSMDQSTPSALCSKGSVSHKTLNQRFGTKIRHGSVTDSKGSHSERSPDTAVNTRTNSLPHVDTGGSSNTSKIGTLNQSLESVVHQAAHNSRRSIKGRVPLDGPSTRSSPATQDVQGESRPLQPWQVQKSALLQKFGSSGWRPRKRLSPDALEGIRALNSQDPEKYTTPMLAEQFEVSPEAIRRILKSKWRASPEEEAERRLRWDRRGKAIWSQMVEIGIKPPKKWRAMGVKRSKERDRAISLQSFSV